MLKFAEPLGTGSHENRAGNAHFRIIQPLYQPHFQIIHPPCNPCTSHFEDFGCLIDQDVVGSYQKVADQMKQTGCAVPRLLRRH